MVGRKTTGPNGSSAVALVTGHLGYLGQVLLPMLKEAGYRVIGADVGFYNHGPMQHGQDIRQLLLSHDLDAVIHLAAIVGEPACSAHRLLAKSVNYHGTKHLIEQCEKKKIPMVFASTCSVYGSKDAILFETSETRPMGEYAKFRLLSESQVVKAGGTALRFGTLFGWSERMRFDLVINGWARDIFLGKPIVVRGGRQWRPFTHVSDAARAIMLMVEYLRADNHGGVRKEQGTELITSDQFVKSQVFNVCGVNSTIGELANTFRKVTGCKVNIDENVRDLRNYRVSSDKIKELGWVAEMSIEDGIKEILAKLKILHNGTSDDEIDLFELRFSNLDSLQNRFSG